MRPLMITGTTLATMIGRFGCALDCGRTVGGAFYNRTLIEGWSGIILS